MENQLTPNNSMILEIRELLENARKNVAQQVNTQLLTTYWNIGRIIVEYEQQNQIRADYGKQTLKELSKELTREFGKGFSRSNLQNMRAFYLAYEKCQTVSGKLSWSHYCELLSITDENKRSFYEKESVNSGWSVRELKRQIDSSLYNSAYYNEPEAPHTVMQAANGVDWYAMQQHAEAPAFEQGEAADTYNQAAFRNFMPGFEQQVAHVDGTHREDGHFEVRHADGSGTAFYDTARFAAPRGDYQVYEDVRGQQWIAIHGDPAVERKPVFEDGKPVYDGENVRTVSVESVRYKNMPSRFKEPEKRPDSGIKAPKRRK